MNKREKVVGVIVALLAAAVSLLAYVQPRGVEGSWRGLFPVVIGVLAGYGVGIIASRRS